MSEPTTCKCGKPYDSHETLCVSAGADPEPDGTDAGALTVILDEAKAGPWKPDDGTSLWFVNEAGDQLHLTGDDVALLLNAALEAQGGPSLDVERLARAMYSVFLWDDRKEALRYAEEIAAEYARLGVAPEPPNGYTVVPKERAQLGIRLARATLNREPRGVLEDMAREYARMVPEPEPKEEK